jgi:hypothetical protein
VRPTDPPNTITAVVTKGAEVISSFTFRGSAPIDGISITKREKFWYTLGHRPGQGFEQESWGFAYWGLRVAMVPA